MARLLGVRANRVIALSFAISGALAAAVGVLLVMQTGSGLADDGPDAGADRLHRGSDRRLRKDFRRGARRPLLGVLSSLLGAYLPDGSAALPRRDRLQPAGCDPDLQAAGPARRGNRRGTGMSGVRLRSRPPRRLAAGPARAGRAHGAIGASGTPSLQGTVTMILCNLIIVLGLQVFIGNSGVYSFGQLGFASDGAYVAALLTLPADLRRPADTRPPRPDRLGPARPAALDPDRRAVCGLAGGRGRPAADADLHAGDPDLDLRLPDRRLQRLANWDAVSGGSSGLVSIPTTTGIESAGLWAAAAVVVALAFKWSARGYRLQATREDEVAARSIGIGVMGERLIAFTLSGMLCGIGGALAVHQSGRSQPDHLLLRRDGDDGDHAGASAAPAASSGPCWGPSRWRASTSCCGARGRRHRPRR